MISISTVTPVYSGAEYLQDLVAELAKLRESLASRADGLALVESIFVLDDPRDDSAAVIRALAEANDWVRVIELSRNFGQHNATVAGILHSAGDWVVTLDEDLQHPPSAIPRLLSVAAADHLDVVQARPERGAHGSEFRDGSSILAKKLIGLISGNKYAHTFGSFRLMRGPVARAAASACSHQTYFDVALVWFTTRIASITMPLTDSRYQEGKKSGYSFFSLLSHAKRLLLSSDVGFFKLAVAVSGVSVMLALLLQAWVLFSWLFVDSASLARGWASLMSVNLFYGSVLSLLLGFIVEMVRSAAFHGQGKPAFFVIDRGSDADLLEAISPLLDDD